MASSFSWVEFVYYYFQIDEMRWDAMRCAEGEKFFSSWGGCWEYKERSCSHHLLRFHGFSQLQLTNKLMMKYFTKEEQQLSDFDRCSKQNHFNINDDNKTKQWQNWIVSWKRKSLWPFEPAVVIIESFLVKLTRIWFCWSLISDGCRYLSNVKHLNSTMEEADKEQKSHWWNCCFYLVRGAEKHLFGKVWIVSSFVEKKIWWQRRHYTSVYGLKKFLWHFETSTPWIYYAKVHLSLS